MAIAIVCGLLAGVVGFLPLVIGLRIAKKVPQTGNLGQMGVLLLCLLTSFILMFAAAVACVMVARDMALPFVLCEAIALSVVAIAFGIRRLLIGKDGR